MSRSIQANPSRQSAPMLATFLTIMYGVLGACFAIVFYSQVPELHFGVVALIVAFLCLLLYLMRRAAADVIDATATFLMRHRNDDPLADYSPARKRGGVKRYGDQRPMNVEEVRRAQADRNVFVPAKGRRG